MKIRIRKKKLRLYLILVLITVCVFLLSSFIPAKESSFNLLSSDIAEMETEGYLKTIEEYKITHQSLKLEIEKIIDGKEGVYAIYFEDLDTGAWIGINEKHRINPASLLKVPLLVSVLKKVEEGELTLEQTIRIQPSDIDNRSGPTLAEAGPGKIYKLKTLLRYLVQESDNTAMNALERLVTTEDKIQTRLSLGLQLKSMQNTTITISPKEYSNIFRSLYHATYLKRPFSQLALSYMAESVFEWQIISGLPEGTVFSHKVGYWKGANSYHDCGIIYVKDRDYLLCIMTEDTPLEEAAIVERDISRAVFEHITES